MDFWRRYIGQSRKKLARAVNFFYPGGFTWSKDPSEFIGEFFPFDELRQLFNTLETDGEQLENSESEALARFGDLLEGKWFDITRMNDLSHLGE